MKIRTNENNRKEKILLINYSDRKYRKSQNKNSLTGLQAGGFYRVISYERKDIDQDFYLANKKILDQERGGGYWLWKPYFIKKALEQLEWNDYLFYSDAGCYFIDNINHLIKINQDVIPFELQHIEKKWTKRDAFILMDCDSEKFVNTKQRLASYSFWKKTPFSMRFINEWLEFSKDERLSTDMKNTLGKDNYETFKEHRHDQSIFSLLTKKYDLLGHRNPSQFGNDLHQEYLNSDYPQLIVHDRQMDTSQRILRKLKRWFKR